MLTWSQLATALPWRPIQGCPGRLVLRGGRCRQDPGEISRTGPGWQERRIEGVKDPVVVVPLLEGGLICYRHEDGTWTHTLGDPDGFSRKLGQLQLDEATLRAEAARERGDLPEARRWATAALEAGVPRSRALLASIVHLEGDLEQAARLYRRALGDDPEDAGTHAGLAVVLAQLGRPQTARAHGYAALAGDGLSAAPWLRVLRQARDLEGAIPETLKPWERCAVPSLPHRGSTQRITLPEPAHIPWTEVQLADALRDRPRVVALTGSGISSASGLETRVQLWRRFVRDDAVSAVRFREHPTGLWEVVRDFWGREEHPPNAAHRALAALPGLVGIVTQNVDELHQQAAQQLPPTPILELHGSLSRTRCVHCGASGVAPAWVLAWTDPLPPRCPGCGGVLRPDVVLFGEKVRAWDEARACVEMAELLLIVGCAMDVSPASELPLLAAAAGARIVEIKRRPSGLEAMVPVFHVAGLAEQVLPEVLRHLHASGAT